MIQFCIRIEGFIKIHLRWEFWMKNTYSWCRDSRDDDCQPDDQPAWYRWMVDYDCRPARQPLLPAWLLIHPLRNLQQEWCDQAKADYCHNGLLFKKQEPVQATRSGRFLGDLFNASYPTICLDSSSQKRKRNDFRLVRIVNGLTWKISFSSWHFWSL